jgi:C_GCAxxG_C_C family probable redox protein
VTIAVGDYYLDPCPDILKRVSCAFGGGVGGCRQEMCGVLGGGVVALGALYGRQVVSDNDDELKELICRFRDAFIAHFGTSQCEPIRDAQPDIEKRCRPVVQDGTRLLVDLIEAYNGAREHRRDIERG